MAVNTTILIPCSRCKGTGHVELTGIYAETLALLRKQADEVTGADLAPLAGCKAPAMNNRLAALERMGLAWSRRSGPKRLYRAEKGATP